MKNILQSILDGLTFKDLVGKRRPRTYAVIAGLILFLLALVAGLTWSTQYMMMSAVRVTPRPMYVKAEPTAKATESPATTATTTGCPTDPAGWSLVPVYENLNYDLIQPACVYQGLEKTIAWALAVREGYSRAQATQALGFTEMPMRRLDQIDIPFKEEDFASVPVSFIPPDPNLTEWRLDANGGPAVTYALRGCFRTSKVVGNRLEVWGGDYPVICLVVEDAENTHTIYSLDGHIYASAAIPMRSFLLFGYVSDGTWVWLGTQDDPNLEIKDPQANARERLTVATLYDSQPWDARWLKDHYGLGMQPPPDNWQAMTDPNEKDAVLHELLVATPDGAKP